MCYYMSHSYSSKITSAKYFKASVALIKYYLIEFLKIHSENINREIIDINFVLVKLFFDFLSGQCTIAEI